MGTLNQDLTGIKAIEDKINANKVATFAYTETAYQDPLHYADGVMVYDVNNPQNIPVGSPEALRVNETILAKGWRSQASSISRMLMNHFLGRCSYNLNQVNDQLGNLLSTLISHLGNANGIATLDANGRIPFSQLPESAMEFKGTWNAQTNTPQLVNGSGTNGDFYVCNVAGTVNFGAEDITFLVNDRAIYNGSVWSKLSAGDIRSVDGFSPDPATGNVTLKPAFTAESAPADNLVSGSTLPTLFGRIAGWINNFVAHRNNTSNPHSVTKSQVGLGSVANTGDSANTSDGGTTKFTTGGAYKLLTSIAPYFSTATTYHSEDLVTYQNRLWKCTATHTGAWNDTHFAVTSLSEISIGVHQLNKTHIELNKGDVGLGEVVNTGISAKPVQSSNLKFTAGGAYEFFGRKTEAKDWLSIALGWAYGKCYRTVTALTNVNGISAVVYLKGKFFAYGTTSYGIAIWLSSDGYSWSKASYDGAKSPVTIYDLKYDGGYYLASSDDAVWSNDGINWHDAVDNGLSSIYDMSASLSNFVAVGYRSGGGFPVSTSQDTKTWTPATTSDAVPQIVECVVYGNGLWVAGCEYQGAYWSSNGTEWHRGNGMPVESYVSELLYDADEQIFIAGCYSFRGGLSKGLWWSEDGKNWSQSSLGDGLSCRAIVKIMGRYYAVGTQGVYVSDDGKQWTQQTYKGEQPHIPTSLAYANGTWVVIDRYTTNPNAERILAGSSLSLLEEVHLSGDVTLGKVSFARNAWFIGGSQGMLVSDYTALRGKGYVENT